MALKRLSKKCASCKHKDECSEKLMEMLGCLKLPEQNLAAAFTETMVSDMVQPMAVKHDYRNIKVGENTTVTIDLEELKEKLQEDLMKSITGGGFLQNEC